MPSSKAAPVLAAEVASWAGSVTSSTLLPAVDARVRRMRTILTRVSVLKPNFVLSYKF